MSQEMTVTHQTVAVREAEYSPEQWATLRRLVKLRSGQPVPHQEEMTLMVQEAAHLDLDPFAGECYFINFGDGWVCYPHWSGLVKTAEATGEYEGHEGPWYSDDGETWTAAWKPDAAPKFCKVRVFRTGHRPTEVVVKYSRVATGSPNWRKAPEEQLGKAALRLAIRRAFPREADKPLSGKQLKALHMLASLEGLGGDANRPARLEAASEILGKPVESFKDLSVAEASELHEAWTGPDPDEDPIKAIGRLGDERRAGDPWVQQTEGAGGAVGGSGDPDDDPAGAPWPPDLPVGGEADAVRPASGAERHGEPRQATLEPDGRSEARRALEEIRDVARRAGQTAFVHSTMREYFVSLGPDFARKTQKQALDAITDEQTLTLAGMIEDRLPIGGER